VETLSTQVDPEGRMRHFRLYFYPVARGPELARVVLIRRDITRRTELEQRLTHSQKMASIGELSTYIAHEIRNPVFAIAGFANALLRDEAIGDSSREKLRIILEESRRLDEILKAIINFARPVDPGGSSCDAAAVAREALYAVLSGSGLGRVETTINLAPGLPRTAIDPDLLKQCLINLIVNSREAMPEGGKLRLGARLEGGRVAVSVEDTGAGIPPDIRDKIFSPFFSTKGRVAGLGLAMARKIMEDIGGAVELASSPGKGTSVTLLLPPVLAVAQSAPTA
jgi:signal transduction histidine kinase